MLDGGREGDKGEGAEGCSGGGLRVEGWHRGDKGLWVEGWGEKCWPFQVF